jgi:hypothetical protein
MKNGDIRISVMETQLFSTTYIVTCVMYVDVFRLGITLRISEHVSHSHIALLIFK